MSEKKVVYQANVVSHPNLKMEMDEVFSPNPRRNGRQPIGSGIKQPGIEMETIVTKLITHFTTNHK